MKKILFALLFTSALAAGACKERKSEPRPNYEGSHGASEKAHDSLDKEAGGY
ncbi:MAG: hypothetical protein Q8T11_02430 [Elusimicrobiota bacterium]|nr:hypothetical protein [Elusimicrobiota bacterium]